MAGNENGYTHILYEYLSQIHQKTLEICKSGDKLIERIYQELNNSRKMMDLNSEFCELYQKWYNTLSELIEKLMYSIKEYKDLAFCAELIMAEINNPTAFSDLSSQLYKKFSKIDWDCSYIFFELLMPIKYEKIFDDRMIRFLCVCRHMFKKNFYTISGELRFLYTNMNNDLKQMIKHIECSCQDISFSPGKGCSFSLPCYCSPDGDNNITVINSPSANQLNLDQVEFTALAPKTLVKGDDSIISIVMYEEAFRHIIDEIKNDADVPMRENKGGVHEVKRGSSIKIVLTSEDIELEDNTETMTWCGGYLNFTFPVSLPEDYSKSNVRFKAILYVDDLPVTKLNFNAKCMSQLEQKLEIIRKDVLSAFVSYASQDRARVLATVQGMKSIAPKMDIFVDITRLKSGDEWDEALCEEIIRRDIFFLFWSLSASQSKWVEKEWRYALENKGDECIEPVPIEPQGECPPPPEELSHKHFNDPLLYVINACKK